MTLFCHYRVYSNLIFKRLRGLLPLFLSLVCCCASSADILQVGISNDNSVSSADPRYYFEKLLFLALAKTEETDGPFIILRNSHGSGIERNRAMLVAGIGIDVMWGSVTKEREASVRVVPVNLLKNLNNYRALLINGKDQTKFDKINSLSDLRKLTAGSGVLWTDTKIFQANGFNVMTTANYMSLYKMLAAHRVDFISRGLHEIGYDFSKFGKDGLAIENNIIIKYDVLTKYSFFVKKDNIKLAERIERGLKIAELDGSFDELFNSMPTFKLGMDMVANPHRVVIELNNRTND